MGRNWDRGWRNPQPAPAPQPVNPYVPPAPDPYPGGDAGVASDLELRNQFAGMAGNLVGRYSERPNRAQLDAARDALNNAQRGGRTDFSSAYAAWDSVPLTAGQMSNAITAGYNSVYDTGMALGRNLNQQLASRGLSANPHAAAALGQQGQFEAAGQRGRLRADLDVQNAGLRAQRASGYSNIAGMRSQEEMQRAQIEAQLADALASVELTAYAPDRNEQAADLERMWAEYQRYLNGPRSPDSWRPTLSPNNPYNGALRPTGPIGPDGRLV